MRTILDENQSAGSLGSILLQAMSGKKEFFLIALDWLIDHSNNAEVSTYEAKLIEAANSEGTPKILFGLDVLKKFGSKSEREFASKLLREYHKLRKGGRQSKLAPEWSRMIRATLLHQNNLPIPTMTKILLSEWRRTMGWP